MQPRAFDELITEAEQHPVGGWDFSWLGDRMKTVALPWDFAEIVLRFASHSPDQLDLGTGGGEWLAALPHHPHHTVATEAWAPNVPIAAKRLEPLGIEVIQVDPAPNNSQQDPSVASATRLPFDDGSFHLITDRHEAFVANEVARVLAPGGHFVTQQLGDGVYQEFRDLFELPPVEAKPWLLPMAVRQLEAADLVVDESAEGSQTITFADVGALSWYLRMVPWTIPNFSASEYREQLAKLHDRIEREGALVLNYPGFWVSALRVADDKTSINELRR